MAYTIPKTWGYKESLSAADMNTYIRDNIIALKELIDALNPVGTIREFNVSTNPATLLGFGTWTAYGTGRVTVAIDAAQTEFDTVNETGGEKTHLLTGAESGEKGHNHTQDPHNHTQRPDGTSIISTISNVGNLKYSTGGTSYIDAQTYVGSTTATNQAVPASNASQAHNNLQPYIVVYRWVRTA